MTKPDAAVTKSHVEVAARLYGSGERWPTIREEMWMAKRLGIEGLFTGVTRAEERRERIGERIREVGPDTVAGRRAGQPETWGELYVRAYEVSL